MLLERADWVDGRCHAPRSQRTRMLWLHHCYDSLYLHLTAKHKWTGPFFVKILSDHACQSFAMWGVFRKNPNEFTLQ